MAGVKGRSGGPRPNSGGARPGAGRPPNQPQKLEVQSVAPEAMAHQDPKLFLLSLMNDSEADVRLRVDAAKALMPFLYAKMGETGKKEQKQENAEKIISRFAQAEPPRLVVNKK